MGDLDWEQLLIIHKHALKFYEVDRQIALAANAPMMVGPPPKESYTARELHQMKLDSR